MILSIHESDLKRGLCELNPDLHFDLGTAQDMEHPGQDLYQSVCYRGRHLCGMGRGTIPEFNRYSTFTEPDGTVRRDQVIQPGWRQLFNKLAHKGIPNVSWETIGDKFGIEYNGAAYNRYEVED